MRCSSCGADLDEQNEVCPHCRMGSEVKPLSKRERDNFDGLTIEEEKTKSGKYYEYREESPSHRIHVRQINLNFGLTGLLGKLTILAFLIFVFGVVFFVALPLLFLLAIAGSIVWFLFLRRR
ncbi:MAG TPA: hypothetical protein PKA28_03760 [Methylomusa anaerophila]|uniref:Zinc-ribbon domain-containing protein n=1 Tax=Methylomusa anaerophila TaxID=1930071 RepID=A0A348ANF4_9FIRM|nr:hypothetical protein [Methylomusa anaerophila]BBB92602.1 hypothetical protein MAMMFC1_03297 [Methylomusa anaerophila]HML87544.1 hypothetical protein [Methylomusa anaerophila]